MISLASSARMLALSRGADKDKRMSAGQAAPSLAAPRSTYRSKALLLGPAELSCLCSHGFRGVTFGQSRGSLSSAASPSNAQELNRPFACCAGLLLPQFLIHALHEEP